MTKRLPPMIDDPAQPQSVRDLLEAGRNFEVSDYDFDRGLAEHLGQIKAGVPAPQWAETLTSTGAAVGATGGAGLAAWLVLPILTAGVIAAVVWSTSSDRDVPSPAAPVPPSAAAVPLPAAPTGAAIEPAQAPASPRAEAAPSQPLPRVSERAHVRPGAHAAKRSPAGANRRSGAKAVRPELASEQAQPNTAARPAATGHTRAQAPAAAAQPAEAAAPTPRIEIQDPAPAEVVSEAPARPAPAPQDDARLEREMAMLAMSQRVLHADPARALKLARQGESEFEGSMFTQERQQVLLLALVKLGRLDEAKRLAKPYLARYPKGPFSDRVRRALATGRVEH